ncbi:MAG: hypothetical protein Kow0029_16180 [Candidatus Rifleibacteriota bacterium]
MENLNNSIRILLFAGLVAMTGCGSEPAKAPSQHASVESKSIVPTKVEVNGKSVNVSDVKVVTDGGKTTVSMPGITVSADESGKANVNVSGAKIDTDENGNAKISLPGINVDASADGSTKANVGGVNIDVKSQGDESEVTVGGVKVSTEGDNSKISLPGGIEIDTDELEKLGENIGGED